MAGGYVMDRFPAVRQVTVTVAKQNVPIDREISEVSVETTFGR
jgi:dihydroneopterin aldolase